MGLPPVTSLAVGAEVALPLVTAGAALRVITAVWAPRPVSSQTPSLLTDVASGLSERRSRLSPPLQTVPVRATTLLEAPILGGRCSLGLQLLLHVAAIRRAHEGVASIEVRGGVLGVPAAAGVAHAIVVVECAVQLLHTGLAETVRGRRCEKVTPVPGPATPPLEVRRARRLGGTLVATPPIRGWRQPTS